MKKTSTLTLILAVALLGSTSPVSAEDLTEQPATEKTVTEKTVTETPVAATPANETPVYEKSVTEKKVSEKPATNTAASDNSANETPSNYVVLKGGMYSPSMSFDINNFNAGNTSHVDAKTGFSGELAVGHYFLPILAVELGAGYFQSKGSPAAQAGSTMLRVVPLTATAKVFLPLGAFEPYGLAGIGAYISNLAVTGNSGNFNGSTEITYGFHAGAGFNIKLSKNVFAGLEGRYLWAEPSFGGQHVKLDGFSSTVNIGYRF